MSPTQNSPPLPAEIAAATLLDRANEAMVYVDAGWVVRYCNDTYLRNIGRPRQEVVGHTPFEYIPNFERSIFYEVIESAMRQNRQIAHIGYSNALGRWLLLRCFPFAEGGGLMLANDATDSVVQQHQLSLQAPKDLLTGLPNKLELARDLQTLCRSRDPAYLIVLGMNRFRAVNDAVGFAKGDHVLMNLASYLKSATIEGEKLYRLAGDEFAVLSTRAEYDLLARVAALQAQAARSVPIDGLNFVLGAAAGVASVTAETDDEEVLKRASLAMQEAKRQGAALRLYEESMDGLVRSRVELETDLRLAVERGGFELHLQPKASLADRTTVGAEALIRWPHPSRGLVSPAQFLPLAHDCGLTTELDRWVLREAVRHIAGLRLVGQAVPISINMTTESLGNPDLVTDVADALAREHVPPQMLEIEIPEGALMRDVGVSSRVLNGLHDLGVRLSIDDFGTGYSSFAYLTRFPVQTLKIDRSFVADMLDSDASRKVVRGLVRMAHSLGMKVVAEGAETEEQIERLQRMSCDEVQGYGYARPMPYPKFLQFVASRARTQVSPFS